MCQIKTAIDYSKKNVTAAYHYLIEYFAPVVYLSALVKLKDQVLAQKATEEVFFYAYNNIHRYQYKISFVKWLIIYTNKICHEIVLGQKPNTIEDLQQLAHIPENHKVCLLLKNLYSSTRKIGAMLDTSENEIHYIFSKYPHVHIKNTYLNVDIDKCKQRITNKYSHHPFITYLSNFFLGLATIIMFTYSLFGSTPHFFYAILIPLFTAICICKLYTVGSQYIHKKSWQKLTLLLLMSTMTFAEPNLWAGVDKQNVNEHDEITLTMLLIGKSPTAPPSFSLSNLQRSSKPQTIVTAEVIDGKQITLHKYVYKLSPQKTGAATISQIRCQTQKQIHTQPPITIKVTTEKTSVFPKFFVEMRPQAFQLYTKQICPLTLTLYHPYSTKVENVVFSFQESSHYKKVNATYKVETLERRGPFIYKKILHHLCVVPLTAGKIKIAIEKFHIDTFTSQKENLFDKEFGKDDDFADDFFRQNPLNEDFGAQRITLPLQVADVQIDVKPLPTPPANFIGAVGEFSATATWEENVSDLCITLHGNGNLETVENVFFENNDSFIVKKYKSDATQYLSPQSLQVQKKILIHLQYLKKGNVAIHPYFCYFHPQKQKYEYIDISLDPITATPNVSQKSNAAFITLLIVLTTVGILYKFTRRGK